MILPELVVVSFAGVPDGLAMLAPIAVCRVVAARDFDSPPELARAAEIDRSHVLWLPTWTVLTPGVVAAVAGWLASAVAAPHAPRVARARLRWRCGSASLALAAPQVVLSSAAAIELGAELPQPRAGAQITDLDAAWDIALPADLNAHLDAVNRQSSTVARLRHAAGRSATWRDLTLTPLAQTLRSVVALRGARRAALPHLVIEAYRDVLVTAKLWELAHPSDAT